MKIPKGWNLENRKVLITADKRGWTKYFVDALAEAGADVAIAGSQSSDMSEAKASAQKHGTQLLTIETDLTNRKSIENMMLSAREKLGNIDVLVNNAKADFGKPFNEVTEKEWDSLLSFNLKSMFLCCQEVGKHMVTQGQGRIINMTSTLSVRGLGNSVTTCAAEGAIHQFTQSLALEWARTGIRVNGIGAGWITADEQNEETQKELLVRFLPSRRRGHPNDLAALMIYLASDQCDFVNGQTILVDGGALAHA